MPRGKILVIRGGAIGDFILTLPVLRALRERFSNADLEVLGYPHIVQVALAGGLADRVSAIEARGMAGFFARNGTLEKKLISYFSEFNLIVSYLFDPDGIFLENVTRCTDAQFIVGPHRLDQDGRTHATDSLLKPLERLAIFDADPIPRLDFPDGEQNVLLDSELSSNGDPKQWLAVHPGSGGEKKNWTEAKWADLIQRLVRETDLKVLLVGGEAEGERLSRVAAFVPKKRLRLARSLSLVEVALLLRQSNAYVGHDSGISHLAGAVGLKGILLWDNTNAAIWKPRTDRLTIITSPEGLVRLCPDTVFTELMKLF